MSQAIKLSSPAARHGRCLLTHREHPSLPPCSEPWAVSVHEPEHICSAFRVLHDPGDESTPSPGHKLPPAISACLQKEIFASHSTNSTGIKFFVACKNLLNQIRNRYTFLWCKFYVRQWGSEDRKGQVAGRKTWGSQPCGAYLRINSTAVVHVDHGERSGCSYWGSWEKMLAEERSADLGGWRKLRPRGRAKGLSPCTWQRTGGIRVTVWETRWLEPKSLRRRSAEIEKRFRSTSDGALLETKRSRSCKPVKFVTCPYCCADGLETSR